MRKNITVLEVIKFFAVFRFNAIALKKVAGCIAWFFAESEGEKVTCLSITGKLLLNFYCTLPLTVYKVFT